MSQNRDCTLNGGAHHVKHREVEGATAKQFVAKLVHIWLPEGASCEQQKLV